MFVIVTVFTVFTVFRLLTDFVCLYNYEFGLSLCKIVRSSVILLLPLLYWITQIHVIYCALSNKVFEFYNEIILSEFLLDMTSISNVFNTLTLCHDIRQVCSKFTVTSKWNEIRSTRTNAACWWDSYKAEPWRYIWRPGRNLKTTPTVCLLKQGS